MTDDELRAYVYELNKTIRGIKRAPDRRIPLFARALPQRISRPIYEQVCIEQQGRCAVCRRLPPEGERLFVDHDHLTGAPRGLLCRQCNFGLGSLGDDPHLLRSGADYLDRYRSKRLSAMETSMSDNVVELHPGRWLRKEEVAQMLGLSPTTVWRMVDKGELKCIRCRGKVRIPLHVVEAWQREQEQLAGIGDNARHH